MASCPVHSAQPKTFTLLNVQPWKTEEWQGIYYWGWKSVRMTKSEKTGLDPQESEYCAFKLMQGYFIQDKDFFTTMADQLHTNLHGGLKHKWMNN